MLDIQNKNAVCTLTLSRAEVHNALNPALIDQLKDAFITAEENDDIRIIVLKGAGKNFCAGADLEHMKSIAKASEEENKQDALTLASLFETIYKSRKPTIAVVQGAAFGGGVGLACACDFVIGDENSQFCLSEVKLGLVPGVISPHVIRAIGLKQAKALTISARRVSGLEAFQLGFITNYCDDKMSLDESLDQLIGFILKGSPHAQSQAKDLLEGSQNFKGGSQEQTNFCANHIAKARSSDYGQKGLDAFLNKKSPDW